MEKNVFNSHFTFFPPNSIFFIFPPSPLAGLILQNIDPSCYLETTIRLEILSKYEKHVEKC